jgi:hypothetical protein
MINLRVSEEGKVSFGKMSSSADNVVFFTKNRFPHRVRGGSPLLNDFLSRVLSKEQFRDAHVYAQEQADRKLYHKNFYQKCSEILGCTPSKALKLWNAAEFYTKVQPRLDLVDLLARGRGGMVSAGRFQDVVKTEPLLRETLNDNLKNILPWVFCMKKNPKELRDNFGKSLWKRLCKNSFHRNNLLVKALDDYTDCFSLGLSSLDDGLREILLELEKIPSTLLANKLFMHFRKYWKSDYGYDFVNKNIISSVPMCHVTSAVIRIARNKMTKIIDTKRMADQLGVKFNIWKYDIDSFEKVHDLFTQKINEQMYSPEPIKCLDSIEDKYLKVGSYEIELLDSRYAIHQEGVEMRHCVGSYAGNVAQGEYLVYSIKKDGKRVSTLGLNKGRSSRHVTCFEDLVVESSEEVAPTSLKVVPTWEFDQHYSFANGKIQDMMQVFLADLIISRLNGVDFVCDHDLELFKIIEENPGYLHGIEFPVDMLKFNPYDPLSYKSVYDYYFK